MREDPWPGDEFAALVAESIYGDDHEVIPDTQLMVDTCTAFEAWSWEFRQTCKRECFSEAQSVRMAGMEVRRDTGRT